MKRRVSKRLVFRRDTLQPLEGAELSPVAGGSLSCVRSCDFVCATVEFSYCVGRCNPR